MMTTSFIASINLWNAPRSGLARMQSDLATATAEIARGRYADLGLALGSGVGRSLALRQDADEIAALKDSNALAAARLATSQTALGQMQSEAAALLKNLIALPAAERGASVATASASALSTLAAGLGTAVGGAYVFGGTNTGENPVRDGSLDSAKAAVAAAFQTRFGFAPGSAGAAAITPQQMTDFLDGPVAALFTDGAWQAGQSQASSRTITGRISLSETVTTSASANAAPFRALAMAYAVGSATGLGSLSTQTQTAATDRVMSLLDQGGRGIVALQADLGRTQARITAADARLDAQAGLLKGEVDRLEAVDPAEAKTRVDALTTQIQMSYALTSQLRQLSLVSFIA